MLIVPTHIGIAFIKYTFNVPNYAKLKEARFIFVHVRFPSLEERNLSKNLCCKEIEN